MSAIEYYNPEVHDELAVRVHKLYEQNPTLTINLIASQLDARVDDVEYVINSYLVLDGVPEHIGPGQGGNWLPPENRVQMTRNAADPELGIHVGYRWPDGELREEIFDEENPKHRELIGLE